VVADLAEAVSKIVRVVIRFAPFGIFGLVGATLTESGLGALLGYGQLLLVIVGSMLFVAFVMNPLFVFWKTRSNPYPAGVHLPAREWRHRLLHPQLGGQHPGQPRAVPRLGLHEDTYSISIPLGATINMAGAAITIAVMSAGRRAHGGDRGRLAHRAAAVASCPRSPPAARRVWQAARCC
jgi:serine/threonine transporter